MEIFLSGQFLEKSRGDLAVVITQNIRTKDYNQFMYPIDSEEFAQITGIRTRDEPIARAYVGVNHKAGEGILRKFHELKHTPDFLGTLDVLVINGYYLAHPITVQGNQ